MGLIGPYNDPGIEVLTLDPVKHLTRQLLARGYRPNNALVTGFVAAAPYKARLREAWGAVALEAFMDEVVLEDLDFPLNTFIRQYVSEECFAVVFEAWVPAGTNSAYVGVLRYAVGRDEIINMPGGVSIPREIAQELARRCRAMREELNGCT